MSRFGRRLQRIRGAQQAQQERANPFDGLCVAIGTPSGSDDVSGVYCRSVVRAVAYCLGLGIRVSHEIASYSVLPLARQILVQRAIEAGSTHIVMIDDDMEFAPEVVPLLVSRGLRIVAANCMARRKPHYLTARRDDGTEIPTDAGSTGVERAARVGTGVICIRTDVFREIALPWFEFKWTPEKGIFTGEDFAFCDKARAAGFDIWVDHDASKLVVHWGQFGYQPQMRADFVQVQEEAAKIAAARGE